VALGHHEGAYDARILAALRLSASPTRSDKYPTLDAAFASPFLSLLHDRRGFCGHQWHSHVLPNMQADATAIVDDALMAALNKRK